MIISLQLFGRDYCTQKNILVISWTDVGNGVIGDVKINCPLLTYVLYHTEDARPGAWWVKWRAMSV